MTRWLPRRRVRFIPQLEAVECGAASLAMVLDYHGCSASLVEVRTACNVSRDGSSAAQIVRAAREYGLGARALKLELAQLRSLPLPAILHWEFTHFVVLERISRRGASLVDPAHGRVQVSLQQLSDAFTGVAVAFAPTSKLHKRPHRSRSLTRYLALLKHERLAVAYIALVVLLLEVLAVLYPAATQVVIDHVIRPQRDGWLLPIALALGAATLTRHALEWFRERVLMALATSLDLTLMSEFLRHLMRLPLSFFEQRSAGDLMQRVEANGELREISATLVLSCLDTLLLIAYAALLLAYDVRLGALALGVNLARLLLIERMRQPLRQGAAMLLTLTGREQEAMVEALYAPETLRALGAESALFNRYDTRLAERLNAEVALKQSSISLGAGMAAFDAAALALVVLCGGQRVLAGEMTIGVFAGFLTVQALVAKPLAALFHAVDRYLYAQGLLHRVDDVLDTPSESHGALQFSELRGEVVFERVAFRHGKSSPWLFEQLSFRVAPGEKVAIVGRSGQGKSTILKLILGILKPSAGRILIDGVELGQIDLQALAPQIGVVLQEPWLCGDSVEANLRLRVPDATQHELETAARIACVHEVIDRLPQRYRTRLESQGRQLSGGQRQRLAVARAIVRNPRLLLLDEATNSLDLETEAELHANLAQLSCTRLIIAHRLATVRDADRVLVIDAGRIAQQGRYDELAREPGLFRELLEALPP